MSKKVAFAAFTGVLLLVLAVVAGIAYLRPPSAQSNPTTPMLAPLTNGGNAQPKSPRVWIMNGRALNEVTQDARAKAALAGDTIYVTGSSNLAASTSGLHLVPTKDYVSEAKFENDLASGAIPANIRAVLYDNEPWPLTPTNEKKNLVASYQKMGQLAHAHGLILVATPVPSSNAPKVAQFADVVDVQAQWAQATVLTYLGFAEPLIKSSRLANPKATVLSGISTNPPAGDPTVQQLLDITRATFPSLVRGWWLNIPQPGAGCPRCNQPRPDTGVALLQQLGPD